MFKDKKGEKLLILGKLLQALVKFKSFLNKKNLLFISK
jgi:hypothetical protein